MPAPIGQELLDPLRDDARGAATERQERRAILNWHGVGRKNRLTLVSLHQTTSLRWDFARSCIRARWRCMPTAGRPTTFLTQLFPGQSGCSQAWQAPWLHRQAQWILTRL